MADTGDAWPLIVSIHAPTRGATSEVPPGCGRVAGFQSTRPRGARLAKISQSVLPREVSIHAPTRGATLTGEAALAMRKSFNPRAHEGRDSSKWITGLPLSVFQSTRPRGARPAVSLCGGSARMVSIHAPTRGATRCLPDPSSPSPGFNPRAHEGRDSRCSPGAGGRVCFNPRAHEGRDPREGFRDRQRADVSIHAPTRGATRPGRRRW